MPPLPAEWSCIEEGPPEKGPPPDAVAFVFFVVDFANPLVIPPNFRLQACFINDNTCAAPFADPARGIGVATEPLAPILQQLAARDESGTLTRAARQIILPYDPNAFYGFIRITADNYATIDYVLLNEAQLNLEPVLEVPSPQGGSVRIAPIIVDPIGLPSFVTLDGIYEQVGVERDPSKATTVARTFNCDGVRAANVGLETNVSGERWALQGGIPQAGGLTDTQGIIGYANLNPVGLSLNALVPTGSIVYQSADIPARANIITTFEMRPPNARQRQLNITLRGTGQQQQ